MNISKKLIQTAVSAALAASILLPSALALYPAKVKADALYLRKSPGGEIITTLKQGTTVAVIKNSDSWFKVAVGGKEGYVSGEFLAGTSNGDFLLGSGRVVCDTTVNLREQPNMSAKVLTSMPNGATVSALGVYSGWYKVSYNGKTGYMHPDYLTFGAASAASIPNKAVSSNAAVVSYIGDNAQRGEVLAFAAQYLGTPYVYGGSTPSGFDCSGFTSYVFSNTVGTIPRVAQSQFDATNRVSMDELLPGDLVFFGSSASSISHVGIYVGDNQFIHSPHTGDVVKYDTLTGTYSSRFQGGGRVITD
ncbi:C40 family peptidase [Agathobaculum sp.]|uniref:C40 family peptidase n=1 Tax=Agathobaculum sp. TaxID=2048138 RepID=UPI002A821536|nr:SH3 domain-containing protein [Agathobaculum sp.]MDY3618059.1 SH3 domain-containing protein [Agathobaculum sp.]